MTSLVINSIALLEGNGLAKSPVAPTVDPMSRVGFGLAGFFIVATVLGVTYCLWQAWRMRGKPWPPN